MVAFVPIISVVLIIHLIFIHEFLHVLVHVVHGGPDGPLQLLIIIHQLFLLVAI